MRRGRMLEPVIIDAVRTPVGRYGGVLKDVRPDDLAALVIQGLVRRNHLDPQSIEDVILGCGNQAGEDNRNVARMAVLLSGLPVSVAGQTVNRLCGSGLQAGATAAHAIRGGEGEVFIAGGVESMTRAPYVMAKPAQPFPRGTPEMYDTTIGWRFVNPKMAETYPPYSMGETAEIVAEQHGISREEQDAFALESQRRAARASAEGKFKGEIVPVVVFQPRGDPVVVDTDEHPRPGTSPGINDGAAGVLLMAAEAAAARGYVPRARIIASAVAGVDPSTMGLGPIPATRQVLACVRDLQIPLDRLNPNGGAIALGHPIGCSGARILTSLLCELERREGRDGLATMCIGVGQGVALGIERIPH